MFFDSLVLARIFHSVPELLEMYERRLPEERSVCWLPANDIFERQMTFFGLPVSAGCRKRVQEEKKLDNLAPKALNYPGLFDVLRPRPPTGGCRKADFAGSRKLKNYPRMKIATTVSRHNISHLI